ncbi:MAG TPA: GMC family oxidoreductase N-terminal domain-containing protein [Thermoleophilaceae bacterium]|nr:GMC family oxidoreductase N-terminal domain-containing protein [Thermoleophilaceae bacterium]
MELTEGQRHALKAICDTVCPGGDGLPSASELGVPEALLEAIDRNPRAAERRQLAQLLSLWDSQPLTAFGGGGWKRFSELPQDARERVLLSWCDSRLPQRRAAFRALCTGTRLFYWMLPAPDGSPSPAWADIGYPGPLGPNEQAPPKAIAPLTIDDDTDLDCDVVVVGSGAGGGTAAGVLAAAGLDVVVLEAGGFYDDADFDGSERNAIRTMYAGAPTASADQSLSLLAGACLGGGTVINYSTSFRTPDAIREEWAGHGVHAFADRDFEASLDAVCDRLGVNHEHSAPSSRDRALRDGCMALGWHVDAMPRDVRGCDQGEICGYCPFGCRLGAKQSTVKTWLADAHAAGTRILVGTKARSVIVESGAARGVEAVTDAGHRVTVRARAVVAACGAIQTPALLRRSALRNRNIGQHLHLHPVTVAWGLFDDELRPWEGAMQALYSDQHAGLEDGFGVKYETAAMHPHVVNGFWPWRGGRAHHELMRALPNAAGIGALLRDRDAGEVRVGRDGEPVVRYRLSSFDRDNLRTGLDGAAQILEAAGAKRIFSSHAAWVSYDPGVDGDRNRFMRDADRCGWGSGQVSLASFHIMGSARMGGTPSTSACTPAGEAWDVRDLVVCDASAFPSASGVNPMVSIEAIAHMNASALAARLS